MTENNDSFTIQELEENSGFDRRTISYYVQQGLLPKVGKRGRGTLYPPAFSERLLFIRAVRDLQDIGALRAVSLAEIKQVMQSTSTVELMQLRHGSDADASIRSLFSDPDWDTHGLAVPVESITGNQAKTAELTKDKQPCNVTLSDVKKLIRKISKAADQSKSKANGADKMLVLTSCIQIADNVFITVDNLSEKQQNVFIELANALSS